ncbi:MAG TPA: serine/threonine-protein kinase, partial [Gemmatales bacterium]|nr:serine/threonine-protein kinase [Gemmatales bacterium]
MPSHLPDDRSSQSSVKDNVIYLNATQTQVEKSAESNSATPFNPLTDAFHQDGSVTVKSGGLPATAWQASAAELAKLLIGKQLGCYVIREALGTGAMAAVFKAYDPLLDRYIALKILPPVLAAQADQIQRFEREAKLAAQMDHEHVARVHYFGQDQGLHFIAYEYVEGTNLRVLMEQHGGKLPVPEGIRYLHQAALGLAHAAARGVIHRDIKPNKLVINKHGVLKLVDLGLARNSLDVSGEALTQAGATLGTFDYLSPEQAIDPRLADVRSDIYSLGCTFYHALTGMPPVPEGTAARKLQSHHQEKPVDPSRLNPAIPQELVHILARMLAKKPKDRYQTADELVADTSRLLSSYGDSSPARVSRLVKEPPPIPWHWQMAAILLLLLGILGYEVFSQRKPASSPAAIIAEYTESRNLNQQDIAGSTAKSDQVPVAPVTLEIETTEDLVQALRRNSGGTLLLKRELYELRASNLPVIKQGEWTIKPLHDKPTTLRLPEITNSNFIEVKAGSLRLENLVLDIAGLSSTGIQCYSGTHLQIENCE